MRIVEFGPNRNPVYNFSGEVAGRIKSGSTYIGIDLDPVGTITVRNDQAGLAVHGDIGKIPLRNGAADEVWLVNVFSGGIENKTDRLSDGTVITTLGEMRYFQELHRILTTEGVVHIAEWLTRAGGDIDWLMTFEYRRIGFTKQVFTGKTLDDFIAKYQWSFGSIINPPSTSFFITLIKAA